MGIQVVDFQLEGESISTGIRYKSREAENVNAVYTYRLWSANSNAIITRQEGNNLNDENDKYWLPSPASLNNERFIEFFSTLKNNSDEELECRIEVDVCQSDDLVDTITDKILIPAKGITNCQIFIQLKGK